MGAIQRYYLGLMPSSGGLVLFYVGAYDFGKNCTTEHPNAKFANS